MDRKFIASLLHTGWLQTNPLSFGEAERAGAFAGREWGGSFHRQRASPGGRGCHIGGINQFHYLGHC